uniref:Aquaporin n=1 Tax=Graphocephala atropunctata TaxID=36148 RepID=A0A1B6LBF7_9HEMI
MVTRQQSILFTDEESKEVKVYTFSEDDAKGKEKKKSKVSLWRQDLKRPWHVAHRAAVEFLGTTFLVYFATTTCAQFPDNGGVLQRSLTMTCIYATLIQALSFTGGCHLNPMVTIGFAVLGKVSWVRVMAYTNAQYVAAVLGTYIYKITTPEDMQGFALCANKLNEDIGVTWWQGLLVEALVTSAMTWAVFTVTDERGRLRPGGFVVIGLAYGAGHLMAIPLTSAGMNPARSLGPAVLGKYWIHNWVFAFGPQIGIKLAALAYWLVNKREENPANVTNEQPKYEAGKGDEQL